MPDLPTRRKRENELAVALLLLFQVWEVQEDPFSDLASQAPEDMAAEVAIAVAPTLAIVHAEAASQLVEQTQFVTSGQRIRENSEKWAEGQATELGKQVAKTTAAGLLSGKTRAEVFSSDRAELIAVSEVTDAVTMGEAFILVLLWDEAGRRFEAFWYTEADGLVCAICAPLHKKPKAVWILVAPTGPKAHPVCRCWLEYEEIFDV